MLINSNILSEIMPKAKKEKIIQFSSSFNKLLAENGINTVNRVAAFMAQIAHESGNLFYVKEVWGPNKWQVLYEGKKDLGNIYPGDGKKFLGRGLIQVTGRSNYEKFGQDYFNDKTKFTKNPELLETPDYAVLSAIWFWNSRKLNQLADVNNFKLLTQKVNGKKMLGYAERLKYYLIAKKALTAKQDSLVDSLTNFYKFNRGFLQ